MRCKVCKSLFEPIVDNQQACSATCAKAVKLIDELGRVYAALDLMHLKAWLNRKDPRGE